MLVIVALAELQIEFAESLKDKRMVVRSLVDKLRAHFHVSATEVGLHDAHRVAKIGLTFIALDNAAADAKLSKIETFIADHTDATFSAFTSERLDFDDTLGE